PARTSFPTRRSSDLDGNTQSIWVWKNGRWEIEIDTSGIKENAEAIEQAKQDIEEAQQTADEAVEQIDTAVANAGFTSLDETISSVQSISNQAQINAGTAIDNALEAMNTAGTAIDNALEAMQQASQAVENTGSLNVRVDDVENTLSVKADKQTVDDLTGVVDLQALDIKANADGLKLKANQDTVDLIDGRVSSLGTEVDVVAGQISNKVWNTDIESAIDGIEVGGRNLAKSNRYIPNTKEFELSGWATQVYSNEEVKEMFKSGEKYTVSYFAELIERTSVPTLFSRNTGFLLYSRSGDGNVTLYVHGLHDLGDANHSKTTFVSPEITDHVILAYTNRYTTQGSSPIGMDTIKFTNFKIEKGTKATDWTPAPEDTDAKITSNTTSIEQ